jgi:hypothetical protein
MGLDRIPSAPFSFFKNVTDEHRSEHPLGIVWLVLEQKAQLHPIVKRLVNEVGATPFIGCLQAKDSALCDLRFMTAASTLVLSPSTFSWWAAYLGTGKVHFPVLPFIMAPRFHGACSLITIRVGNTIWSLKVTLSLGNGSEEL